MLTITDFLYAFGPLGTDLPMPGGIVSAVPAQLPLFLKDSGGVFRLVQNPQPVVTSDAKGKYSLALPWPSETNLGAGAPVTINWQLLMPDGSVWQGTIPEAVGGPVTVLTLRTTYSWTLASGPTPALSLIQALNNGAQTLTYNALNQLIQSGGSAPSAAAGAQAGGSPPAPVVTAGATDLRGRITFGTGSAPAAGALVAVTFANPYTTTNAPIILLTPGAGELAAMTDLYVSAVAGSTGNWTGFTIASTGAPAASQPNTTYTVYYLVIA